jgi:NADH-quinone oxidoreductase subunit N
VAAGYVQALEGGGAGMDPLLILGTLFVFVGIAFKLAAVPFHFWCPDVFEGAATEVAAFLSVASKGAALALLARFALVLAGRDPLVGFDQLAGVDWMSVVRFLAPTLAFFAALTATFGNLAAYLQTNLKRLLAYSTIAHAGYMMMGLAPLTRDGAQAVLFYMLVYLVMNLGAFAVVAFIRNQTGSEDLSSYRGLIRRAPWLTVTLTIFLLSLLGLPPLAGFAAKFQIFMALFNAGDQYVRINEPYLGYTMWALLVIGGINTVLSAFYYIKVIKVMILETDVEEVEGREPRPLAEPAPIRAYVLLLSAAILVAGIFWDPLAVISRQGVDRFKEPPSRGPVAQQTPGVQP